MIIYWKLCHKKSTVLRSNYVLIFIAVIGHAHAIKNNTKYLLGSLGIQ